MNDAYSSPAGPAEITPHFIFAGMNAHFFPSRVVSLLDSTGFDSRRALPTPPLPVLLRSPWITRTRRVTWLNTITQPNCKTANCQLEARLARKAPFDRMTTLFDVDRTKRFTARLPDEGRRRGSKDSDLPYLLRCKLQQKHVP